MAQIDYINWDTMLYYDSKIKNYIELRDNAALKYGGELHISKLPQPLPEYVNTLYKISEPFNTNYKQEWFHVEGSYPKDTIVQIQIINDVAKYSIFTQFDNRDLTSEFSQINSDIDKLELTDISINNKLDELTSAVNLKQHILVSGKNISTINGQSLLTGEDISINSSDNVKFTEKPVAVNLGGFTPGMTLNDKTIAEIIEILLCKTFSPDTPKIVGSQLLGEIPVIYAGGGDCPRFISQMEDTIIDSENLEPSRNCVYQTVNMGIIESTGYQVNLPGYGKHNFASVFIPKIFDIKAIQIFDKLSNSWIPYNGIFRPAEQSEMIGSIEYIQYIDSIANSPSAVNSYRFDIIKKEGA